MVSSGAGSLGTLSPPLEGWSSYPSHLRLLLPQNMTTLEPPDTRVMLSRLFTACFQRRQEPGPLPPGKSVPSSESSSSGTESGGCTVVPQPLNLRQSHDKTFTSITTAKTQELVAPTKPPPIHTKENTDNMPKTPKVPKAPKAKPSAKATAKAAPKTVTKSKAKKSVLSAID